MYAYVGYVSALVAIEWQTEDRLSWVVVPFEGSKDEVRSIWKLPQVLQSHV